MTFHPAHKWFLYLLSVLLLTACSGGGDSSIDLSGGGVSSQGIAVDPYIEGAVFQEVDADTGAVLQRQSSPSDEFGLFTFPRPLTPGSVVEMKISNKGLHGGAPYQGMLRRQVTATDEYPVVVSPLTTMLANGASPENIIALFNDAGITGLTISDLYDDPMQGLPNMTTGITDEHLIRLQAAMAADAYMEATGNYLAGWNELNDYDQFVIFRNMVSAMKNLLNAGEFENVRAALSNDADMTEPLILEDFILTVLAYKQTIVAQAKEDMESYGDFNPALVEQAVINAKGNAVVSVKFYYRQRVSATSSHDGAALYNDNCSLCHDYLAYTNKPGRSGGAIQAAIDNNVGNMGFLGDLTPGEVQAIADVRCAAPGPCC
ncbi:MAG: hypothetical protein AMJ60_11505 [Desulfobacterales bacterium SG8_35]|nr:MAG: hypothetical protein AMJ60_11505 [Desulfobacterales bacterium SG8_35]